MKPVTMQVDVTEYQLLQGVYASVEQHLASAAASQESARLPLEIVEAASEYRTWSIRQEHRKQLARSQAVKTGIAQSTPAPEPSSVS